MDAALGLPSVPNIVLPADVAANVAVLQGCNPGESLSNLQAWLDAIGCSTAGSDSLVKKIDGTCLHGEYHQMLQRKHTAFIRALQTLHTWHTECLTNNFSCGVAVPGQENDSIWNLLCITS